MYDNDSKGLSYTAGFFMLIAFAIAGLTFASLLSVPVWERLTGTPFSTFGKGMLDPANANVMKLLQVINSVIGFLVPTLLTAYLLHRKPMKLLGLTQKLNLNQVGLTILIIGTAMIIGSSLSFFMYHIPVPSNWKLTFDKMEADYDLQIRAIVNLKGPTDYVVALFIMAFIPALCEETLFRGGMQNFLSRGTERPWLAIVIVSILFSLAHYSYYGFLSRFFLGMVLGAIYNYSGKLWLSIMAHFIYNGLAVTMLYVYLQRGKPIEEIMGQDQTSPWGLLLIPIVIFLFAAFRRISLYKTRRLPN